MAENKTRPTKASPAKFLAGIENERRRSDGHELLELMQEISGEPPVMWGPTIVGFGTHRRGKGCLYINKLDDVDRRVLRRVIEKSVRETRKRIAAG